MPFSTSLTPRDQLASDQHDQSIGAWNTGAVTHMSHMFDGAGAFNQPIGAWDMGAVKHRKDMFKGTPRECCTVS